MGHRITVNTGSLLLLALILLVLPLKWFLSAVIAAVFHELCHMAAVWACGGRILSTGISASGAVMSIPPMDRHKEALCAAAGPLGSLFLLSLARWIPTVSLCAGVQGIYNLLPVYPLDGGRILRCFFSERVCSVVKQGVLIVLILGAILTSLWLKSSQIFLLTAGLLCIKAMERKIPCNEVQKRVQ